MNNLKRVLSLVMSGAMLVSMLAIGASAANKTFTDSNEITHTEAVSTMAALGVIKGKDTGAFDPKGNVTRAEMAKIICVMRNGGLDPAWGTAAPIDFEDTKSHWARNYIAWCANEGIIAGQGDGTFNPDGNVTGAQAAKMMLVALGYKPEIFGLEGAKWEINTNGLADSKKLYKGIKGLNTSAALSRDDTAQLAYNTLEAKLMITSWESVSNSGEVTYKYGEGNETFLEKYFDALTFVGTMVGNYDFSSKGAKEGEISIDGKLVNSDGPDVTANVPSSLSIDNIGEEVKVIFTDKNNNGKPDKADEIYGVFNTGNSDIVVAKRDDVDTQYTENNYMIKVDGVEYKVDQTNGVTVWTNYSGAGVKFSGSQLTGNETVCSELAYLSTNPSSLYAHNGDELKMVMNENGEVSRVYITTTKLAVVTAKNATKITLSGVGGLEIDKNDIPTDLAKDDVVTITTLYKPAGQTGAYSIVRKADKISGEIGGFRKGNNADNVVVGGTTYQQVPNMLTAGMPAEAVTAFDGKIGETFDLYTINGFVWGAVQTSESANNYSVVLGISGSSDKPGDPLNGLKLSVMDAAGVKTVLSVSAESKDISGAKVAAGDQIPQYSIVTYTVSSTNGEAVVKVQATPATGDGTTNGYDMDTKTFGNVTVSADCVLFASNSDKSDTKAYTLRNLGKIDASTNTTTVVKSADGKKVVAVYLDMGKTPSGAADEAVYGIVSDVAGVRTYDNVDYIMYNVDVNSTTYTVLSNDTLAKGNVVTFKPVANNVYETGDVTVVTASTTQDGADRAEKAITGFVVDYNTADNTITVATAATQDANGVWEATEESTVVWGIDEKVVISFVDKQTSKGADGAIGAFDGLQGKKNVVIKTNADGKVSAIIFETSNYKDILA